ncbi:UNKNOWN [Stylonychia lemnae]|uniref:Transmembrane protein n=1 Tax=Stylonychia lemnae TaxID=5949 RepID=A0A078A7Q1_STYLE|nr:UNKNOWN [Stylonychia lemnae]|eukprot:CDW77602.1 UNKNOWN [Stylonychia lemnae]
MDQLIFPSSGENNLDFGQISDKKFDEDYFHSYSYDIDQSYLMYDKLMHYQAQNFFTFKCPLPSLMDYFKLNLNFTMAYEIQANQFLNILSPLKGDSPLPLSLAKLFSIALNLPLALGSPQYSQDHQSMRDQQNQGNFKSTNSSNIYNQQIDYKDIVSLNMQLKSKSIISLLFMISVFIVILRFTKLSENMKKKLPKTLALFWFFSTIQLYLDLNIFQNDKKPYAKSLLIGISPIDHSTNYIPESKMENQRRIEQGLPPNQLANSQQTTEIDGRQQELGGIVSQSLIQVHGLTWRSSLEFYHLCVILFILFMTFVKLIMLHQGVLFVRMTSFSINTLDNLEMFTNSPRVLALFTVSFLAFSQFVGRTSTDKQQYFFQKIIPFFIVIIHSAAMLLKRNLLFTYDDVFCLFIFVTSLSLYYTYESPDALKNNRSGNPFLYYQSTISASQILKLKMPQATDLTDEERLRLLLKNTSATQLLQELEASNAQLANKMTKEEIKKRKAYIEEELRKRREEHEECLRHKQLLLTQRNNARFSAQYPIQESEEDQDVEEAGQDELDEDDYESSDNNHDASLLEYIKKTVDKKYDAFQQLSESGHEFYGMSKEEASQKFQQILLQQLNQQLNEETKKILNLKGGLNGVSEQELAQKLGLFQGNSTQTQNAVQRIQPQQQQNDKASVQSPAQIVTNQGGQGQQQNNAKQTAHKAPTKAPSGRPNQRKRR